jgi:hypothetical protein
VPAVGTAVPGAVCGPGRADAPVRPLLKHTITPEREDLFSLAYAFINRTVYKVPRLI